MKKIITFIFAGLQFMMANTYLIKHDLSAVQIQQAGIYSNLEYSAETCLFNYEENDVQPGMPHYTYKIILPEESRLEDFSINIVNQKTLDGEYLVAPQGNLWNQYDESFKLPESVNYEHLGKQYPQNIIQYTGTKYFQGHTVVHFIVYPLQYQPVEKKLVFIGEIQLSLKLTNAIQTPVKPFLEQDAVLFNKNNVFENTGQSAPLDVDQTETETQANLDLGLVERYIIITPGHLVNVLKPLADWKTRKGVPAVIRTMDWVIQNFPYGVDDADRLRNYIRWSYEMRGARYVLLAGDIDLVPTRIITTGKKTFPTDYYYADLDGTWNENENDIFGEAKDNLDGYPEIYVSRIPVETEEDVQKFIAKLFKYERLQNTGVDDYPENVLYTAADLSSINDGRNMIMDHIDPQINPNFKRTMLTQNDQIGGDPEIPMAELNKNYGLIFSEAHGSYHNFRPGGKGSNIPGYKLGDLNNSKPGIWYMASCETNDISKRSLSEIYVRGQNGGVAYIGNSSYEYPSAGVQLQKEFYDLVFNKGHYHLAEAHYLSRLPYLGFLNWEGPTRIVVYSTVVLGDPEMPVWTDTPQNFAVSTTETSGSSSRYLNVYVYNGPTQEPVANAVTVLYREDDVYEIMETDAGGLARFDISALNRGSMSLTITKHNYIPHEGSISLSPLNGPKIAVQSYSFTEIEGIENQIYEPGETLQLSFKIKNEGTTATGDSLSARLSSSYPFISFINDLVDTIITLNPDATLDLQPFSLELLANSPRDTTIILEALLESDGITIGKAGLSFDISLPEVVIYSTFVEEGQDSLPQDSVYYNNMTVSLENNGKGTAGQITAIFKTNQAGVTLLNDSLTYGNIDPGMQQAGNQSIQFKRTVLLDSVQMEILIRDQLGKEWRRRLTCDKPLPPSNLTSFPYEASGILLNWEKSPSEDVLGYNIFRSDADFNIYEKINDLPVSNAGFYVDYTIDENSVYKYTIQAVDSSGNLSQMAADTIRAWPAARYLEGFPLQVSTRAIGAEMNGIQVYDLDSDGDLEIAAAGAHGVFHIYDHQGGLVSAASFSESDLTFPAAGNVYGDAGPEIVTSAAKEGSDENYIFIISGQTGQLIKQFNLDYNVPTIAVLKDMDADGLDDIIVLTHAGNAPNPPKSSRLFVWKSDGSDWAPFAGWPEEGLVLNEGLSDNYSMGVPAVADLDLDGEIEIAVGTVKGKLHLYQPQHSTEPIWTATIGGMLNTPLSIADINGDDSLEIIAPSMDQDKIFVLDHAGNTLPNWEDGQDAEITNIFAKGSPAVIGNLDDDPFYEIVYTGPNYAYIFNHDGTSKPGWPVDIENTGGGSYGHENESIVGSPVLADLNRDGSPEIIFNSSFGVINALSSETGKNIKGFPLDTKNNSVRAQSPFIHDLNRDGNLEVFFMGHGGLLNAWSMDEQYGESAHIYWSQPYANSGHTGELDSMELVVSAIQPEDGNLTIPESFFLNPNYPNPFNPHTVISYQISVNSNVELTVYNVLGQKIRTLVSGKQQAGYYKVVFDGYNLASGVYFYQLKTGNPSVGSGQSYIQTCKMILLR